jgi:DNA polymerase III alpha subunit (gram-positive type)
MDYSKRPLAITDIETTGLDSVIHEIIDIGLILVDQSTLKVIDRFSEKIKPEHVKTAQKKALEKNGYNEKEWVKAWTLKEAMEIYSEKTKGAIFLSQNAYSEWSFIIEAFKKTGVEDLMDYHRLDLFSIGWTNADKLAGRHSFSLASMVKYFELEPEPEPRRAINGAKKIHEVLKKLKLL